MPVAYNPTPIDFSALAGIGENIGQGYQRRALAKDMEGAIDPETGTVDYNKMVAIMAKRDPTAAAKMAMSQQDAANRYGHNLVFDEKGNAYQTMSGGGLSPVQGEGGARLTAPQQWMQTPDGYRAVPSRGPMGSGGSVQGPQPHSVPTESYTMGADGQPQQVPQAGPQAIPSLESAKYQDEQAEAAEKEEKQESAKALATGVVGMEIKRAREAIASKPFLPNTGFVGGMTENIPGTPAHDLQGTLSTIRANLGFDKLQAIRDASKSGAALGAISDFENKLLQSVLGDIQQSRSAEQLDFNLRRLDFIYNKVIHQGVREGEDPFADFDQSGGAVQAADPLGMR